MLTILEDHFQFRLLIKLLFSISVLDSAWFVRKGGGLSNIG